MLVLSRRESQRIKLGDSIVVTVVRVAGDRVRLGIEAPSNVVVLREELQPHERPPEPLLLPLRHRCPGRRACERSRGTGFPSVKKDGQEGQDGRATSR